MTVFLGALEGGRTDFRLEIPNSDGCPLWNLESQWDPSAVDGGQIRHTRGYECVPFILF